MSPSKILSTIMFWAGLSVTLIALPLIGAAAAAKPLSVYLEFPPVTRYVRHAAFSWHVFGLFTIINLALIGIIGSKIKTGLKTEHSRATTTRYGFPVWGRLGILIMVAGWWLAWTRFPWFSLFQRHTFCLPWIGYILTINALCRHRSGHCLLSERPWRFALLFPLSALFWWFFEYLNRFVQNWYYTGVEDFSPLSYTLYASLAFATVLPAVLSTYHLLLTFSVFDEGPAHAGAVRISSEKPVAAATLLVSGAGLSLLSVLPDMLFGLVWIAPLVIILSLQTLAGHRTILYPLKRGDWRPVVVSALAALICGFFWEMWNIGSLARWEYAIPYVYRFKIFAMPVLGYGGYLPFGLECLAIAHLIFGDGNKN